MITNIEHYGRRCPELREASLAGAQGPRGQEQEGGGSGAPRGTAPKAWERRGGDPGRRLREGMWHVG